MENTSNSWLVMKFGGTSLGTSERLLQVAEIIRNHRQTSRPIVVLSAMSSKKKSEGTTSRLLAAANDVLVPNSQRYLEIVDQLEHDHVKAASDAIKDLRIRSNTLNELRLEFQKLRNFLEAAEIIDEISPRSKDVIIGTGEKLISRIFAAVLNSVGVQAEYVPLDKLVDSHMDASLIDQRFYDDLSSKIATLLLSKGGDSSKHIVPVVTGFLGYIPGGILETIGRGYTDFTAALASAGMKRNNQAISELQIWKEVDGIFTADPRHVPTAKLLTSIYPDEAAELTYYGSEVIHPFTMEQVIRTKVPIRIKNTFSPNGTGTIIIPEEYNNTALVAQPEQPSSAMNETLIHATAVTLKSNVICINIHSNRKSVSHGFLAKIFTTLDRHGIVVDLISTSEVHVSMAVSNTSNNLMPPNSPVSPITPFSASKLDLMLRDLKPLGDVSVITGMAILSLVGKQMKNMVGISGKLFSTLASENVNIEMISQGASEVNISCVVLEADAMKGLKKVHDVCVLGIK